MFYNNGLSIAGIDVCDNSLRIRFADSYGRVKYARTMIENRGIEHPLDKIGIRIELTWEDGEQNCILSKTYTTDVDYFRPKNILVNGIDHVSDARTLTIRLAMDESVVGIAKIRLSIMVPQNRTTSLQNIVNMV